MIPTQRSAWSRILRALALLLLDLLLIAAVIWGNLALWYQLLGPGCAKAIAAAIWSSLGTAAVLLVWRRQQRWRALVVFVLALISMLLWWSTARPSHDRDWADDVAHLMHAEVNGNHVVISNVRNFEWRGIDDYTPRWETREYDLDHLVSADMFLSYWMGPAIAHTLVSFGFDDGRHLVFSLEIRKERNESFSAIGGFFRQFESVLIASDENDIIRVRSNVRGEDVHIYPMRLPHPILRSLFLSYVDEAHELEAAPRFYNTLTSNCTTVIYKLARRIDSDLPLDYRILLSGYLPGYLHDLGVLAPGYDLTTLAALGHINKRAIAADANGEDFSLATRHGVPGATTESAN